MAHFLEFALNVATVPVDDAADYVGDELAVVPGEFEANYRELQKVLRADSHGHKRVDMPVIPNDRVEEFRAWLEQKLGKPVTVKPTKIPAAMLSPTQSQIWLEKIVKAIRDGKRQAANATKPIMVSGDDYILDGHHRWATVMIEKPFQPMNVLQFSLPIKLLQKLGKWYNKEHGIEAREGFIHKRKAMREAAGWSFNQPERSDPVSEIEKSIKTIEDAGFRLVGGQHQLTIPSGTTFVADLQEKRWPPSWFLSWWKNGKKIGSIRGAASAENVSKIVQAAKNGAEAYGG